jgi:hypothetical protein
LIGHKIKARRFTLAGSTMSAFCSLLGRRCQLFPLLSVRQMGPHYSVWQR